MRQLRLFPAVHARCISEVNTNVADYLLLQQ